MLPTAAFWLGQTFPATKRCLRASIIAGCKWADVYMEVELKETRRENGAGISPRAGSSWLGSATTLIIG